MLRFDIRRATRAILMLLICCCGLAPRLSAQTDELMIVEYVDWDAGSGFYIKIYNPTETAVDLSDYTLWQINNAANRTCAQLSGTLLPNGAHIVGNNDDNCQPDEVFDNLSGVNGDDALLLSRGDCGANPLNNVVDMIGNPEVRTETRIAGADNALAKNRVIRNPGNCQRYTLTDGTNFDQTDGSSAASWPTRANQNLTGWRVEDVACLTTGDFAFDEFPRIEATVDPETLEVCLGVLSQQVEVELPAPAEVESVRWTVVSQPAGADATFSDENTPATLLDNLTEAGEYLLEVRVESNNCKRPRALNVWVVVSEQTTFRFDYRGLLCPGAQFTIDVINGFENLVWEKLQGPGPGGLLPEATQNRGEFTLTLPEGVFRYRLTGNTVAGCEGEAEVEFEIRGPEVNAGPDIFVCEGETAELQPDAATVALENHVWAPPTGLSNDVIAAPEVNGDDYGANGTYPEPFTRSYLLLAFDEEGCSNTDNVTVTYLPLPRVSASAAPQAICEGESAELTAQIADAGEFDDVFYNWSVGGTSVGDGAAAEVSPAANTTYDLSAGYTFTGAGDQQKTCASAATVDVEVNPLPVIDPTASPAITCINDPIQLRANLVNRAQLGGAPAYSWREANDALTPQFPGRENTSANIPDAGTYVFELTATSPDGCETTEETEVEVIDEIIIEAVTDPPYEVCPEESINLEARVAAPASLSNVNITWDWPANLAFGALSPATNPWQRSYDAGARPDETEQFTLNASFGLDPACRAELTFEVVIHPRPEVNPAADKTEVCEKERFELSTTPDQSPDVDYRWLPVNQLIEVDGANVTASAELPPGVNATGNVVYTVTALNQETQCQNAEDITIEVKPIPEFSVSLGLPEICPGETTFATADPNDPSQLRYYEFRWLDENDAEICGDVQTCQGITGEEERPHQFTVEVADTRNPECVESQAFILEIKPRPDARASADRDAIRLGETAELTAEGGVAYQWAPRASLDAPNSAFTTAAPEETTTYTATVVGANDCEDTAQVTIEILPFIMNVPTVFTPNGDGVNDELLPLIEIREINNYEFKVFDRWGTPVFETATLTEGWNGENEAGQEAPESTYFYRLTIQRGNGEDVVKTGSVTLLR